MKEKKRNSFCCFDLETNQKQKYKMKKKLKIEVKD